ncbi:MAG TPA: N-acetyl sugar amidotransferase [Clostridiaceae bacterium]|nr:N-acetyl sugar amidotransferase [Clostridiaceae bacterium]
MDDFITLLKKRLEEINEEQERCKRCLMDTTADDIVFDEKGFCNYCTDFLFKVNSSNKKRGLSLESFVNKVKSDGKKKYDCIVGVSGGVDSSYALLKAKELGLRPLAVHMDNGWDSELASNNIKNLVEKLNVDLCTYVIDWKEYRELMQAFFDADVIDVELLYDNAMLAVCYQQADKYGIKYILAGTNTSTEGMKLPKNWNWFKYDKKNIRNLAKLRNVKLKTFPAIGTLDFVNFEFVKKIKWISFLDYLPKYSKSDALKILQEGFSYQSYPYKHYESVFTRLYQGFILPVKFGVDKRKNHLSTLVLTGEMKKEEAEHLLKEIPYPSEQELINDIEYFLERTGWSKGDFMEYLKRPEKPHSIYGSEIQLWERLSKIYKLVSRKS